MKRTLVALALALASVSTPSSVAATCTEDASCSEINAAYFATVNAAETCIALGGDGNDCYAAVADILVALRHLLMENLCLAL